MRFALAPFALSLRTDKPHPNHTAGYCDHSPASPPKPDGRMAHIATSSKVNPDLPFTLKIFWIEFNVTVLSFPPHLYQKGIAKIIIVQMKHRFVVAVSIRPYDLTV